MLIDFLTLPYRHVRVLQSTSVTCASLDTAASASAAVRPTHGRSLSLRTQSDPDPRMLLPDILGVGELEACIGRLMRAYAIR